MKSLRILLLDSSTATKNILERKCTATPDTNMEVMFVGAPAEGPSLADGDTSVDAVLFGEKLPASYVLQSAKSIRARGITAPMLLLTRQSEARVPRSFRQAGVDDILNVAEMSTPLFPWTFLSALRQVEDRKKAKLFDDLTKQVEEVHKLLATITHEINNPLSIIRLILYHLENPQTTEDKRTEFLKMLADNIDRINSQIEGLRLVRKKLSVAEDAESDAGASNQAANS